MYTKIIQLILLLKFTRNVPLNVHLLFLCALLPFRIFCQNQNDLNEFKKNYFLLTKQEKIDELQRLLLTFDHNSESRSLFKECIPKDDDEIHFELCKCCYKANKKHLVQVLFALIPKYYKNLTIKKLREAGYQYELPRPGTLGSEEVYTIKLDNAEIYFFMDLEKYELARSMVETTNHKMHHSVCTAEFPLTTIEVTPISTMFEIPVGYTRNFDPINIDPIGTELIDEYTTRVTKKIKSLLGLNFLAISRQMSLVVSHDAMRFHRDQLPEQYEFLNKKGASFPKCWLAQDLTLMDWDMSPGTLSGTAMEDTESGDRYYLFLRPGEVTTNLTLDPPVYPADGSPPVYPGANTLPYHSATAPIDYYAEKSAGSSKGKRISNVARGVVLEEDVISLRKKAIPLAINRPTITTSKKGSDKVYRYPNGILKKEFNFSCIPSIEVSKFLRMPFKADVEILKGEITNLDQVTKQISDLLSVDIKALEASFYKLIKRGSGFSNLRDLKLEIPEKSYIVLLNRSNLPEHYECFSLSENPSTQNLPWIQMYKFSPNALLICSADCFQQLSLTPVEELFFRNAKWDAQSIEVPLLENSFSVEIDVLIFKPSEKLPL